MEVRDLAPGLWIWRLDHPDWTPGHGWEAPVACTCVESGGEVVLIDPLAPPEAKPVTSEARQMARLPL